MPRSRYHILQNQSPHFLTATINHWRPPFTRSETVNIVLDCWRFLQLESGFQLYGYVILENHLHLIAASPNLSRDMQRFKSYTARQIVAYLSAARIGQSIGTAGAIQATSQNREHLPDLGRRQSPATHRIGSGHAPKNGLHPPEPRQTRLCGSGRERFSPQYSGVNWELGTHPECRHKYGCRSAILCRQRRREGIPDLRQPGSHTTPENARALARFQRGTMPARKV